MSVHSNDLTVMVPKSSLDWFVVKLRKKHKLKDFARLESALDHDKEVRVLNRIVHWIPGGLEYQADSGQPEKLVQGLGLEGCRSWLSYPEAMPQQRASSRQHG